MIQEAEKKPKISLCRKCYGKGWLASPETGEQSVCGQCEGTGRVTVSARTVYDIRPYRPSSPEAMRLRDKEAKSQRG